MRKIVDSGACRGAKVGRNAPFHARCRYREAETFSQPGRRSDCAALLAGALCAANGTRAGLQLSAYGGHADTLDADVELSEGERTRLRFEDVSWAAESFTSPIYYGLRLAYWFDHAPWGVGVDFTHARMIANPSQVVTVRGMRAGVDVAARETLGDTFGKLELSHGQNLLTFNGFYRLTLTPRLAPYAGLGVGVAIPRGDEHRGRGNRGVPGRRPGRARVDRPEWRDQRTVVRVCRVQAQLR